jgi:hypothetical protein
MGARRERVAPAARIGGGIVTASNLSLFAADVLAPLAGDEEFFPTPSWPVHAILRALPDLPSGLWVEPAVGEGAIVRAVEEIRPGRQRWAIAELRRGVAQRTAAELRRLGIDVAHVFEGSFFDAPASLTEGASTLITNPPFSLALDFAEECLRRGGPSALTLLLLRQAFKSGQGRAPFHRRHPSDEHVLPRRPSFGHGGETDKWDYSWFAWGPGRGGRWSVLDV